MTDSTYLADEEATLACGALLARLSGGHGLLSLSGNLGCGKTTLCRGMIRALGHQGAVKSPTFTLVEPYELETGRVLHYDLYRLSDPEELDYLGMRDFLDDQTLTLVEWPERAGPLLPTVDLALQLSIEGPGRRLQWQAHSPAGEAIAQGLRAHYSPHQS